MIAQDGIRTMPYAPLIAPNYGMPYLKSALIFGVGPIARQYNLSVHIPYGMGAGLAGGNWPDIVRMIEENLIVRFGVDVYAYQLEK